MDKKEQAKKYYEEGWKYKDISEELSVPLNTLKSWRKRDKWERGGATEEVQPTNRGAPQGNKNAQGNKGGSPPKRNKNAVKHGLFAKWMPEETIEIMDTVSQSEPADILWNNIMIQYTAIIRSQQIMYVNDIGDISKEESGWSSGESGSSSTMQVQYAWDKQANFLAAQSRAMGTLSNLIKQFVAIADEADERRAKLSLITAKMEKTQAEAKILANQADKLTAGGKANELLEALLEVKSRGVSDGN
ncbi:phage terminase small subunit [Enterococcus faecalis]|uniref:phage terminase small subunit n=1 Tax=Enterococcus faecalis TaxID=1351 RepID=UPI0003534E06|nr:phage terminase small subunit [Enterococcus faecalis]EPI36767.1 putative ATPase subunit of terminase [Enterococcus faecalis LA3B-2]